MKTVRQPDHAAAEEGAVLLEVVLALILFAGAALVIGGGLSASVTAMERTRRNAHAANLAVTVISEMEMGIVPGSSSGPIAFDAPFEAWSWETIVEEAGSGAGGGMEPGTRGQVRKVEVVIRQEEEGYVLRLGEFLMLESREEGTE